ncbi:hypothetical protein HEP73_01751 [Xanthomonas sp. GW]|nr:hypothetical protein HEP73_01751 [Xanthomonas sp. GW]
MPAGFFCAQCAVPRRTARRIDPPVRLGANRRCRRENNDGAGDCRPSFAYAKCTVARAAPMPVSVSSATRRPYASQEALSPKERGQARLQSGQRLVCTIGQRKPMLRNPLALWALPWRHHAGFGYVSRAAVRTFISSAAACRKQANVLRHGGTLHCQARQRQPSGRRTALSRPGTQTAELEDCATATRLPGKPSHNRAAAGRRRPYLCRYQALPAVAIAPRTTPPRPLAPTD